MTCWRQRGFGFDARRAASSYARTLRPEPRVTKPSRLDTLLAVLAVAALFYALLAR